MWFVGFRQFGFFGVDVFFIISGFIITYTNYSKFGDKSYGPVFLKKRFIRIYSNYWLILSFIIVLWMLGLYHFKEEVDILRSVTLFPAKSKENILPVAWSLCHELYFYLLFSLFLSFDKKLFLPILLSWASVICLGGLLVERIPNVTPFHYIFLLSPFHLEFIAGSLIGIMIVKEKFFMPRLFIAAGLIILLATILLGEDILIGWDKVWRRVTTFGVGSAFILYGLVILELRNKPLLPKFSAILGDASYTLYLIHPVFLGVFVNIVSGRILPEGNGLIIYQWLITALMMFSIIFSIAYYKAVEKPVLNFLNSKQRIRFRSA